MELDAPHKCRLSVAHVAKYARESSISVAHGAPCAIEDFSTFHAPPWIAFSVFKKSQKTIKLQKNSFELYLY
jgi:hypothetical protein